jgi:hypothetical protein
MTTRAETQQAYNQLQTILNPQADMQREAMRQTLLNSNSPFALLGRGIGNVANASLPPTADMLRAQIQSNPETNNPSMPESVDNTVETVGNTIKFFQDMKAPNWLDPYQTGRAFSEGLGQVTDEVVGGAKQIGNIVLGGAEDVADPLVQAAQGFMGNEATGVPKGSFGRYGAGADAPVEVVSTPPSPVDKTTTEAVTPVEVDSATDDEKKEEKGEKDTNWFDALESRVDLMAMGAAMLANAGSGRGTFENLGVALQAGLGAKKSITKAEQDKEYKDKLMALEVLKLQNVDNRFKNYSSKIDDLAASLEGKGVPKDESQGIASVIYAETEGGFVNLDSNTKSKLLDTLIDNTTSWYDVGKPDVDRTKIRTALADISKGIL